MENFKELWTKIGKEDREIVYNLIGKTFVTGKRQPIPKAIYDRLDKEQRNAVRYILDLAQECFDDGKWL